MAAPPPVPTPLWGGRRGAAACVALLTALYALGHSLVAAWTWRSLRSNWPLDLAYFHQQVRSLSLGRGTAQTVHWHEGQTLLGDTHFSPILALVAPVQRLLPGLDSLLATQCVLVSLVGVGAARLARSHGGRPAVAVLACALTLLSAPLWQVTQTDVRPLVWATGLLVLLAAALAEGRRWEAAAWALLAGGCREEVPVLVLAVCAAFGIGPGLKTRLAVAAPSVVGASVVLAVAVLLRPAAGTYIDPWGWLVALLPGGAPAVPADMLGERGAHLLSMARPLLPLAFLAPRVLLGAAPLLLYLLTSDTHWSSWESEGSHYIAPAIGLFLGAAAAGLGRALGGGEGGPTPFAPRQLPPLLRGPRARTILIALTALVLGDQWVGARAAARGWVAQDVAPFRSGEPRIQAILGLAASVPPGAPAMGDFQTVALLAGRDTLYCSDREAMRTDFDPARTPPPLLPDRSVQPEWALLTTADRPWRERLERAGQVPWGFAGGFVLYGPSSPRSPAPERAPEE